MKTINQWLIVSLMMFPQIAETIYSPILPELSTIFGVTAETTSLTISLYFTAFAIGVVVWGVACDVIGRRKSLMLGLSVYALGALLSLWASSFDLFLICRLITAFAAAVASIGTQTVMRDVLQGAALTQVFSRVGIALGVSPALGLAIAGGLLYFFDYRGVLFGLFVLSVGLVLWCVWKLPETYQIPAMKISFFTLLKKMLHDKQIWRSILLITVFNISLFSYYQLGPFIFIKLGVTEKEFTCSGLILSLGIVIGSLLNKKLLTKNWLSVSIVKLGSVILLLSGVFCWLFSQNFIFLIGVFLTFCAYGLAIPAILSDALKDYHAALGRAGALLGLCYYLLISLGLLVAGALQNIAMVIFTCGLLACIALVVLRSKNN
ncbi:MFS transporter [Pseudomonas sp. F1_0610]|uniref:MFS transporter n=1 Tax=Pseudomonas sp. F1_0610 TaxID=3114284 RepID=UPI0039C2182A